MVQYTATGLDPFTAPPTVAIGTVRVRDRAAIRGTVVALELRQWAGRTPALHATITDATGSLTVAFPGRIGVAGIDLDRSLVAAGGVILHRGRPLIMNPYLWLADMDTTDVEPRRVEP